jgi:CHAT domain-containing protein
LQQSAAVQPPAPGPDTGKPQWKRLLGGEDKETVDEKERHRKAHEENGKLEEAKKTAQEILDIRRRVQGADHWHTKSAAVHVQSLQSVLKWLADHPLIGGFQLNLDFRQIDKAEQAEKQGRFHEAEPLWRKVLDFRQGVFGEDSPEAALCYNNLAVCLDQMGKHSEAEGLYYRELVIKRRIYGEDHPETATCCFNIADNLDTKGRHAEAEPLFKQALAIRSRVLGENEGETADALSGLAVNMNYRGLYKEAESFHNEAFKTWRRILKNEDHPELARLYNNLAFNLEMQKTVEKIRQANPLYKKALDIRLRSPGPRHPQTANAHANLAGNLVSLGRTAEAEDHLRRALQIRRETLGEDHPDTAACYTGLASVLLARGQLDEAERMGQNGVRSFEAARRWISSRGLDRSAVDDRSSAWLVQASILARCGKYSAAWQQLEAGLGRGLLDDLSQPLKADERKSVQELQWKLRQLESQPDRREEVERLHVELAQIETNLIAKYGVRSGQVYDLGRIQAQLPAETALITWLDRNTPHAPGELGGEHWACLVRRRGEPLWVPIPGSGPNQGWSLEDDQLPGRVRESVSTVAAAWKEDAAKLAGQRLGPLVPHLGPRDDLPAVRHLVFLPSRALAGIPGEVLVDVWAERPARYTVSYAPSATLFAYLQERVQAAGNGGERRMQNLLAIGDPTMPKQGDDWPGPDAAVGFKPLAASRQEIDAIARCFAHPEKLVGAEASQQTLRQLARDDRLRAFDVIHLSTHGQADAGLGLRSFLVLAREALPDPAQQALTGKEVFDGRLTAEEILLNWQLDADLVTLSACESGKGRLTAGEGYVGFSQALFLAGARSMVLSQWKVGDVTTTLLMRRFYENLAGARADLSSPLPKAVALEEAKRWLRKLPREEEKRLVRELLPPGNERRENHGIRGDEAEVQILPDSEYPYEHPYFWAGFILVGDPGEIMDLPPESAAPLSSAGPRWYLWLVLPIPILAGVGLGWCWRKRKTVLARKAPA